MKIKNKQTNKQTNGKSGRMNLPEIQTFMITHAKWNLVFWKSGRFRKGGSTNNNNDNAK